MCLFALAPFVLSLFHQRRFALATACTALMLGFFGNMMFVVSARTALVYMPVMLGCSRYYIWAARDTAAACRSRGTAALVWFTSPYLRDRIEAVAVEYQSYHGE